jgi:hypothetical protein
MAASVSRTFATWQKTTFTCVLSGEAADLPRQRRIQPDVVRAAPVVPVTRKICLSAIASP